MKSRVLRLLAPFLGLALAGCGQASAPAGSSSSTAASPSPAAAVSKPAPPASSGAAPAKPGASSAVKDKLTVAYSTVSAVSTLAWVTKGAAFYDKYGLDATLQFVSPAALTA